ncbi:MAG: RagB/SusD family nutrient uptake outer membrane protein [Bacteroidales bacterium]|nr:RagB/SusD family nutrient uptake outer membrane protein [Bacteroidales bacterium]
MKKIFIALTVVCAALFLTGCESRLDIQKKGVISMEDFYQTDADAESALVNAYYQAARWLSNTMGTEAGWNECPLLNPFEYASDDMFAAGENKADGVEGNQINAFWYNDSNSVITGSYHCYYMIINAANQVIDHFAESADSQVKKRCVAEARVLRAYMHLILAMGWYNPPIVDHVLNANEPPENAPDQKAVLDFVISDCEAALNDLTERGGTSDKDGAVKVTKGFCNAIMGKAMMFKGDYASAKTALKRVIDSGKYDLVPSDKMSTLYHYSGRGNEESVFEFNLKYDASVDGYYQRAQPNFKMLWGWRASRVRFPDGNGTELPPESPWGWCNPSAKFVNTILENDGYDSYRRKAWIKSYDEVLYEMPYTSDDYDDAGNVITPLSKKETDSYRGIQDASGLYGHVGYFMWKRLYRAEDRTPTAEIQWNLVVMRYAEVLLMYAECCAQTGAGAEGLPYLNKVQERAGSKHISTACTLEEVQKEKYIECWLEGSRFPDLVRWGIADRELADNGKYLPNFCDEMSSKGAAKHKGYIDESDAAWCTTSHPEMGFKKEKHSYFPIPFAEKNVNPNIHDWNAQ